MNEILTNLYLGDAEDALTFDGTIICVQQNIPWEEPDHAYWIPIIRTDKPVTTQNEHIASAGVKITILPHQLDMVARLISEKRDKPILVHCRGGMERSPLAVMYYLHHYVDMTWNEAYDFVKSKRPETQNRLSWLNLSYDELMN